MIILQFRFECERNQHNFICFGTAVNHRCEMLKVGRGRMKIIQRPNRIYLSMYIFQTMGTKNWCDRKYDQWVEREIMLRHKLHNTKMPSNKKFHRIKRNLFVSVYLLPHSSHILNSIDSWAMASLRCIVHCEHILSIQLEMCRVQAIKLKCQNYDNQWEA